MVEHTVTFDSVGGSTVGPITNVPNDTLITEPTEPTLAGYTFKGWYKEADYTTAWNFASDRVTSDITLYARWEEIIIPVVEYTVRFDSVGGSAVAPITKVPTGKLITEPTEPTLAGYTFKGWYKDADYTTVWDFASDKVTSDITLYARWEAIPVVEHTVTFDSVGGSTVGPITNVPNDTLITEPTEPTLAGYTFKGWYKEADYTTAWNFASDKVTSDITLYAKWEAIPVVEHTVTFDSVGGSTVGPITNVPNDTLITEPTEPTLAGYTFKGWYKEADYTTAWDFASDRVTSDITLYARWEEIIIPVVEYTVRFDSVGGSAVAPITKVPTGTLITEPTEPTLAGYTFKGWYKEADYTTAWDFASDKVTNDITLYAKWDKNIVPVVEHTVTFDSVGGSAVAPMTKIPTNTLIKAPTEPTLAGYTFKGWYKEADYTTAWDFANDKVTSDITLYAKWDKNASTVSPKGPKTGVETDTVYASIAVIVTLSYFVFILNKKRKEIKE